jgi:hypothetical protein
MKGKLLAGERLKTLFKRYSGELDVVQTFVNFWCDVAGEWTWVDKIVP